MGFEKTMRGLSLIFSFLLAGPAADGGASRIEAELASQTARALDRALAFLAAAQQEDGGWMLFGRTDPAITALVAQGFAQSPRYGREHAIVRRALAFVLTSQQPDGGIYVPDAGLPNYHTSVALMALSSAGDEGYAAAIERAREFLIKLQWDAEEGHHRQSVWYGGTGYGENKRPDLSNTQMMLEALKQSGLPATHPAYQKALTFIARCQMSSHTNDQEFARGAEDGGFIYSPANGGESKAGTVVVDGRPRLRSYGSMTYAGFKSLLYAGVDRNDPRVRQAYDWIRRYYTLDHNPNMPDAQSCEGLYYYYHVFAGALAAWGEDEIVDVHGEKHNWRADLCRKLLSTQASDGSWVNQADRWYEGNPYLVTAYAVLALEVALR
ncbi:MAG: prenyltransferase/squalene oxidase repeat-containing protein [Planctomycetota bacterium]